jgi:hypothetical protein
VKPRISGALGENIKAVAVGEDGELNCLKSHGTRILIPLLEEGGNLSLEMRRHKGKGKPSHPLSNQDEIGALSEGQTGLGQGPSESITAPGPQYLFLEAPISPLQRCLFIPQSFIRLEGKHKFRIHTTVHCSYIAVFIRTGISLSIRRGIKKSPG